jgi:glc operon protein GlcG
VFVLAPGGPSGHHSRSPIAATLIESKEEHDMTFPRYAALAALALFATQALAQPAPAGNPMDVVPEKMPFDVPYGAPISLDRADAVLNAALGESRTRGWKLVCAVVDSGAQLVALKRQDGAQLASIDIANHKARTAAKYRRETKAFEAGIQGGNIYLMTLDDVIGSRGGIPLVQGGAIVGAIGCSGGTGSQDEVAARAGVAALR